MRTPLSACCTTCLTRLMAYDCKAGTTHAGTSQGCCCCRLHSCSAAEISPKHAAPINQLHQIQPQPSKCCCSMHHHGMTVTYRLKVVHVERQGTCMCMCSRLLGECQAFYDAVPEIGSTVSGYNTLASTRRLNRGTNNLNLASQIAPSPIKTCHREQANIPSKHQPPHTTPAYCRIYPVHQLTMETMVEPLDVPAFW